jgi:hypothetical protein
MKKVFACLISSMLCLLLVTCKKDYPSNSEPSLVQDAQQYFNENVAHSGTTNPHNYRAGVAKTVLWDQAAIIELSVGNAVMVPVTYQIPLFIRSSFGGNRFLNLNELTELLIYRDSLQAYHAELVTTLPDSGFLANPVGPFSGFRFVEDWQGNAIAKYLYNGNKPVGKYRVPRIEPDVVVTNCSTIDGYNYSPGSSDDPVEWSESGGCTDSYFPDSGSGPNGGDYAGFSIGGGGSAGNSQELIIASPHNIITDIQQYFQCFTNTPGGSYQVTVCVDQPDPGSRTPWAFSLYNAASGYSNLVDPGHCFLIFTQVQGGGTVTRNVGFYPGNNVNPASPSTQGVLNDDEYHQYNISGSFGINNSLFFSMLAYVSQGNVPGYDYNLDTNNCTTFVLDALAAGHIYLPSTIGGWLGGAGNDPGDLGEDIRSHDFVGMTRSTTEAPHPNEGNCN